MTSWSTTITSEFVYPEIGTRSSTMSAGPASASHSSEPCKGYDKQWDAAAAIPRIKNCRLERLDKAHPSTQSSKFTFVSKNPNPTLRLVLILSAFWHTVCRQQRVLHLTDSQFNKQLAHVWYQRAELRGWDPTIRLTWPRRTVKKGSSPHYVTC